MDRKNKLQLAFIVPSKFMGEFGSQGEITLGLAHLFPLDTAPNRHEIAYLSGLQDAGLPIILDNGLFENHVPEPVESLIKKAMKIKAVAFFAQTFYLIVQEH